MLNENITLKKLHIFLTFMKCRTMNKTAEMLNMSTVSIHRAIHSLETELQCPLFQQQGRLLSPLDSAKTLEIEAKILLKQLGRTISETQETAGIFSAHFKLGSIYSLTFNSIPALITSMKKQDKKLEIELTTSSNKYLFKKLTALELDVIVVSLDAPLLDPSLIFFPLFEDHLALAVPVNDPLASYSSIALADIKNCPFVMLSKGFATAQDVLRTFEKAQIKPNVVMEVNDIFSLISMVSTGLGYSLLPNRIARILNDKVKLIPLHEQDKIKQTITMVCLASRSKEPKILAFTKQCHLYAKSLRDAK
ncbi:transcriptional regulator, substrate-binding of LysR family protein [Psychromonas ingrahamii 37]|uniref:Transcriptional regulator, substrate-binding of LysR family protein n=1 Tax=Psychromonas ingrahamii (strain DSM 17664 / CCUG 51855 / 37) TaxID=357804 RepID=A1T0S8_PSYIN|nr:LysR substrate-binding domain-containing protein [Psychromonas ingrahamii]ABM05343.1 transcriptional regulator, substrate-binding of LysR family protein [Psychromonas ingrahamii 37]